MGRGPPAAAPLTGASRPQCSGTSCRGGTTRTPRNRPPRSRPRARPPRPPGGWVAAPRCAASAAASGRAAAGAAAAPPTAEPSTRRWTGGAGTAAPADSSLPEVGPCPSGTSGTRATRHQCQPAVNTAPSCRAAAFEVLNAAAGTVWCAFHTTWIYRGCSKQQDAWCTFPLSLT